MTESAKDTTPATDANGETAATPTGEEVPPLCEAKDCPKPPLTAHRDGADESWWLCEEHGDLLAVGFETRRPRRTSIEPALRRLLGGVTDG